MKLLHALEGAKLDNVQLLLTTIYRDVKNVWRFTSLTQSFSRFAASLNTGNALLLLVLHFQKKYVEMKMYCLESRSRGISYMKYVNGRRTGLVTYCVETAFYNGLLKERYKGG